LGRVRGLRRGILGRVRGLLRRERLLLSGILGRISGLNGVLEAAQGLTDRRAGIGQLSRTDDDQDDN
jgi:hypothetical protein